MTISSQTWRVLGGIIAMLSAPLTNILVRHFGHEVGPDIKDILDILSVVTVIGGGGYTVAQTTPRAQIEAAAAMPEVTNVVVRNSTNGRLGAMATDDNHPKVVTETANALGVLNRAS